MTTILFNIDNFAGQPLTNNNCYNYFINPSLWYFLNDENNNNNCCNNNNINPYIYSYPYDNFYFNYYGGGGNGLNNGYSNFYNNTTPDVAFNNVTKVTFTMITGSQSSGSVTFDSDTIPFYTGSFTASILPAIYKIFIYGNNSKLKLYANVPDNTGSIVNINTCLIPSSAVPYTYQQ